MQVFSNIREFFWPLLEKEEVNSVKPLTIEDISVDSVNLEKALEYTLKKFEREEDRKKSVDTKASLFIGTISVVTSVIVGITSVLINKNDFTTGTTTLIFLLFILTIYMARTIWFSVQTLERRNYHVISIQDFLLTGPKDDYNKKLIVEFANMITKNSTTINRKVDSMVMAQEYFKRAIVIVTLFSFALFILFFSKSQLLQRFDLGAGIKLVNSINLSGWILITLSLLTGLSLMLSIIAIIRKQRK
jgi:hypothetical protein